MSSGFPPRSGTILVVQPQKMARSLKFQIKEIEDFTIYVAKNRGADQLWGFNHLEMLHCFQCFRICKKQGFS